ncbi:YggS family pyridoxal phosphate-dependent enzyme [Yanshouia hominis]|uniref:Pyridoxal phosphate homeostasis protein n=1 Tax=Yanshouia hominis TaxID=2763673 RepID=A0ABR7NII0_9FIRM|nr:YggS family pyridoxal phosphate-dependent enzyme [Yanshouia hominis]MBC8576200.1 YggS family pyridoxal phosphate-dependent enzyme [Yanshouia hominis]
MMEKSSEIRRNVEAVQEQIGRAAAEAGRDPSEIRLMAVTKTQSAARVNEAIAAGVTLLGENRAQELLEKYDGYDRAGCGIHFIGHLQSNKVRSIVDKVSMIESVDRLSLAQEISRCAQLHGLVMPVLIEVNIGREQSKSGVLPEALPELLGKVSLLPGLSVRGLMAIPPNIEDTVQKEGYFEQMYRHFIDMKAKKLDNVSMTILSMGMSHDYPLAIRHGSNVVRIGRALFGERM